VDDIAYGSRKVEITVDPTFRIDVGSGPNNSKAFTGLGGLVIDGESCSPTSSTQNRS
jgi:hypothetical protein